MNAVERFNKTKKEHEEMSKIIDESSKKGNFRYMHRATREDIYHMISFSFYNRDWSRHNYEKSDRLATYLGEACECLMGEICKMAQVLSKKDMMQKAIAARKEAEVILKTIPDEEK